MKRIFAALFVFVSAYMGIAAETFEQVIERQPPETQKNFLGVTDMLLSKTNNFLEGVSGVLTGATQGDINAIIEGFNKSTDTFRKYRIAHKEALTAELEKRENELAALKNSGAPDAELCKGYLAAGRAAIAAADYAKARTALGEALRVARKNTDATQSAQYDILLAMAQCAYDSYDTEYMLNVRDNLEELLENPGSGTINRRVNAMLASARTDMRIGNTIGALTTFNKAIALTATDKDFDILDPEFNRLQTDLLKKFPDMGLTEECVRFLDVFTASDSPARSLLQPDILAEMLVVRADCESRLGNHRNAFRDISEAKGIIQKANPDGSVAELECLVTLGDIIRRNAMEPDSRARVSNSYTGKGVLYHLNGCRLLASRIWGDEKDGVNPWLRTINGKLALAAVADHMISNSAKRAYSGPSAIKIAQVIAGKAKYSQDEELYMKLSEQAESSRKFARKLYKSELDYMRDKIRTDFTAMDESQRADYMAAMSELVNAVYNFAELDRENKESAGMVYDATLLSKGVLLSFSRSLGQSVRATGNPELIALLGNLNDKRREYVSLEQTGDFAAAAAIRREAGEIERSLQLAVKSNAPGDFLATTWKDVKTALSKNDAAVEFYTFTENLKNSPAVRERMVAVAANKNPRVFTLNYPDGKVSPPSPTQCRLMYSAIWEPLEKEKFLKAGGKVYFAPAGRWNSVPLEYLRTGKDDMNERYSMVRVSTTRNRPAASPAVAVNPVLFGGLDYNLDVDEMAAIRDELAESSMRGPLSSGLWNRLPGTETEVEEIAGIMNSSSIDATMVTGAEGIEERFKALSGENHGIVHIATHGYYNPPAATGGLKSESVKMDEAMDNSGLVFSGANQYLTGIRGDDGLDDGLLTAREIALMDLSSADLVVMSACETGAGRATSEGVLGLQRGFKLAGANTLVMSLWKVNDLATASMMQSFYRNLAAGMDKRAAFYAARADLRKGSFTDADGKEIPGTAPEIGDAFVIMD